MLPLKSVMIDSPTYFASLSLTYFFSSPFAMNVMGIPKKKHKKNHDVTKTDTATNNNKILHRSLTTTVLPSNLPSILPSPTGADVHS